MLMLLVPALNFHFFAVIAVIVCAAAICFWFLRTVKIPEPFNYIVWLVCALVALYIVFWIFNQI